jgi:hypothetical protein
VGGAAETVKHDSLSRAGIKVSSEDMGNGKAIYFLGENTAGGIKQPEVRISGTLATSPSGSETR